LGVALEREFEGEHYVEDLLGRDQQWRFAKNGVANVGIELAPVARGGDFADVCDTVFDYGELAVVFLFFNHPGFPGGDLAVAEVGFERVELAFEVSSLFAEDDEARAWNCGHHGGAEQRSGAFRVIQKNVEGVVGGEAGALDAHVGRDGFGSAEKREGLIEEMGSEVKEHAAAGAGPFAPSVGFGNGAIAIVGGFEAEDAAQISSGDSLAKGLEIGVEAAVVVDGEDEVFPLGQVQEFDGFGEGGGEGFVDDYMFAAFETALGEGEMGLVGSGDDHELDGIEGEKFVEGADDASVWVESRGGIARTLKDCSETEARDGMDDGRVEAAAAEAEAD
jgi:hypothetical protein